jgi:hypothetical protein
MKVKLHGKRVLTVDHGPYMSVETDEFAENHTGIVETERLIEIACQ